MSGNVWRACNRIVLHMAFSRWAIMNICSEEDELAIWRGVGLVSVCVSVLVMEFLATTDV